MYLCMQAEGHWEKALGLNPLFPQGWFALGYCCLKTKNQQRALQVTNPLPSDSNADAHPITLIPTSGITFGPC